MKELEERKVVALESIANSLEKLFGVMEDEYSECEECEEDSIDISDIVQEAIDECIEEMFNKRPNLKNKKIRVGK